MDNEIPSTSQDILSQLGFDRLGPPITDLFEGPELEPVSSVSARPNTSQNELDILQYVESDDDVQIIDSDSEIQELGENLAVAELMAVNEVYEDLIDQQISRVEKAIEQNREQQSQMKTRMMVRKEPGESSKMYFPINLYAAPYFHDEHGMIPEMNKEAKAINEITKVDLNFREPLPWKHEEEEVIKAGVRDSIIYNRTIDIEARKQIVAQKLQEARADVKSEQVAEWREEIAALNRKIMFERSRPDNEIFVHEEYPNVDWAKIANSDLKGQRTIQQVYQKWLYELDPKWNRADWTPQEEERLKELVAQPWVNWDVVAEKLGTNRTPWSCFVKFKRMKKTNRQQRRPWTPYEDEKLINLVATFKIGDQIPWNKISAYIPGRTKHQCEMRYTRSLDRNLKMGRWSENEDMLLLNAVNKYGPRDWERIAEMVVSRSSMQCRDRWINYLDYKRNHKPWSFDEDEKLLMGLKIFGKGNYADIAKFIPGRNAHDVRMRLRVFTNYKIRAIEEDGQKAFLKSKTKQFEFYRKQHEEIHKKFKKLITDHQQNLDSEKPQNLIHRMGMGDFVVTADGQQSDYSKIFEKVEKSHGKAMTITKRGRWKPVKKTVNEYDESEILKAITRLPQDKRKEALDFWNELKQRDEVRQGLPDDQQEQDLDKIDPDRIERLNDLLDTVVVIDQTDWDYFNRYKKKPAPPKIDIKSVKRRCIGRQKIIPLEHETETGEETTDLLDMGMKMTGIKQEPIGCDISDIQVTRYDRQLADFEAELANIDDQNEKRSFVLKNLCMYLQKVDDSANYIKYRRHGLSEQAQLKSEEYIERILGAQYLQEDLKLSDFKSQASTSGRRSSLHEITAWSESVREYNTKSLMQKVVPPTIATTAGYLNFLEERPNFLHAAGFLFDSLDADLEPKELDDQPTDTLDIRFSEEVKSSIQYQLLRKRLFGTFLYGALLNHANPHMEERLKRIKEANDRIEQRKQAEREWRSECGKAKLEGQPEPECPYQTYQQEAQRLEQSVDRPSTPIQNAFNILINKKRSNTEDVTKIEKSIDEALKRVRSNRPVIPVELDQTVLPNLKRRGRPRKTESVTSVSTSEVANTLSNLEMSKSRSRPRLQARIDSSDESTPRKIRRLMIPDLPDHAKQTVKEALTAVLKKRPRAKYGMYDKLYALAKNATAIQDQPLELEKLEPPSRIRTDDEMADSQAEEEQIANTSQETDFYDVEDYDQESGHSTSTRQGGNNPKTPFRMEFE